MAKSLLQNFRNLHKKFASVLFVFFFLIGLSGAMLAFKSVFSKTIYENNANKSTDAKVHFLPVDSLELLATTSLNAYANTAFKHSEKVEIKVTKGSVIFYYKNALSIQVNSNTGAPILIEKKFGGIIQDIHDGAILDGWIENKSSIFKKGYSMIMGLSLLLLTITGTYLWYKPRLIKKQKGTI